jgi:V8-like Glu-specific endopeptidase
MICSLQIINNNNLEYVGTGWFAGPRTVITAGHCVFDPVELGGWAKRITVVPGRNGDATSGSVESTQYSTTNLWLETQDADYDYAAIHLSDDIGSKAGSFGLAVLPDEELVERMVNISGYPASPGEGRFQYFHANRVRAVTERRLFYDVDTMGGQSGSPVWAYMNGDTTKPFVVGIHAYGIGGTPSDLGVVANSGPRLLPEVLSVIEGWVAKSLPA